MAIKSRSKSSRGHRELASVFRREGFPQATCVRGMLDKKALPGLSVEVRRTQRLRLDEAMAAAAATGGNQIPLVAHRSDRHPWRVTLSLQDFLPLYRAWLQMPLPDPKSPAGEAYPGSGQGRCRPPAESLAE